MKRLIHYIKKEQFIKDNVILFVALGILNVLGYFFHFYIGRALGPEDYGVVGALMSVLYIIMVPLLTIQTGITNFAARFNVRGEHEKIKFMYKKSLKRMFIIGLVLMVAFMLISPLIAKFFHMTETVSLMVTGVFVFFSFLLPVHRGMLQGLQRFKALGVNYILEGIFKLGSAFIFIPIFGAMNYGVAGTMGSFVVSYAFPFLLAFFLLIKFFGKGEKFNTKDMYRYAFPVLIMITCLTLFYTIDVILVKHFFDLTQAGYYAAISLMGKVIFFGSWSIAFVMFPKATELDESQRPSRSLLNKSILLVLLFGIPVTLAYFILPGFIVNVLFGSAYIEIKGLIGWLALAMLLFSLNYLMSYYNIALKKFKFIFLLVLLNILEFGLIWFMHDTLLQIIMILLVLNILLFFVLLFATYRKNEKFFANH